VPLSGDLAMRWISYLLIFVAISWFTKYDRLKANASVPVWLDLTLFAVGFVFLTVGLNFFASSIKREVLNALSKGGPAGRG
jgi:hypothetical protein